MVDVKALIVARREYLTLVRSKAFVIGLLLAPLLIGIAVLFMPDLEKGVRDGPRDVVLLDYSGRLGTEIVQAAVKKGLNVTPGETTPAANGVRAGLESDVEAGVLAAVLVIGPRALDGPAGSDDSEVVVIAKNVAGKVALTLRNIVTSTINITRLQNAGIEEQRAREILEGVRVRLLNPHSDRGKSRDAVIDTILSPIAILMVVFLAIMSSAPYLLHSVIEEKQQRIAEMLLSAMSPFQLMAGKLLGAAAGGLTVVAVYGGLALLAADQHGLGGLVTPALFLIAFADTLIALALFGSICLAAGAASSEIKDAQGWMTPIMVVMMMPIMVISQVLHSPDGTLGVWLSLFPFTAPMILPVRLLLGSMPAWQVVVSIAGTLTLTVATVWAAGRVFRIGILAQGRAPRLPELIRWIRTG